MGVKITGEIPYLSLINSLILGEEGRGEWLLMGRGLSLEWWKCSQIHVQVMVAQLCKYTEDYWIVYFKRMSFMVCKLNFKNTDTHILLFDFPGVNISCNYSYKNQ